ncbi:MAG TPA: helix-turn-helix transcriptional regulator [Thermomicrobiales bacterium]|nr:helix-turn-helix transcriptional regulator [Thermomicrobiales bacterium]
MDDLLLAPVYQSGVDGAAAREAAARAARVERLACAALWRAAGALLRERREARGWSQQGLARRAGVPLGVVAQYELGEKRRPAPADWRRVTTALGLDLARFLDRAVARAAGRLAGDGAAEATAACLALYALARHVRQTAGPAGHTD